jgi:hypothetical protein
VLRSTGPPPTQPLFARGRRLSQSVCWTLKLRDRKTVPIVQPATVGLVVRQRVHPETDGFELGPIDNQRRTAQGLPPLREAGGVTGEGRKQATVGGGAREILAPSPLGRSRAGPRSLDRQSPPHGMGHAIVPAKLKSPVARADFQLVARLLRPAAGTTRAGNAGRRRDLIVHQDTAGRR